MKKSNLDKLRELRAYSNFEKASFSFPSDEVKDLAARIARGGSAAGDATTELVREVTRNYRESWILPMIDDMIRAEIEDRARKIERAFEEQFANSYAKTIFGVGGEIVERDAAIAAAVDGRAIRIYRVPSTWEKGSPAFDQKTIG